MKQLTLRSGTIKCEHCEKEYTEADYNALKIIGHNVVWNFDYRRCIECGNEIALVELHEYAKVRTN